MRVHRIPTMLHLFPPFIDKIFSQNIIFSLVLVVLCLPLSLSSFVHNFEDILQKMFFSLSPFSYNPNEFSDHL